MSARVSVRLPAGSREAVAVKTATTPEEAAALAHEAERLRCAAHPGVVHLVEHVVTGDGAELHTRFAGEPLVRWRGTLPRLAGLGAAVAATLADLHERGVVHGRLDPSHVLVSADGRPRLCGFSPAGEASPPDDVAALGRLLGTLAEQVPLSDRRGLLAWRRGLLAERHAFDEIVAQATDPVPGRRPRARSLATALMAAVTDAELPPAGAEPGTEVDTPPSPPATVTATWHQPPRRDATVWEDGAAGEGGGSLEPESGSTPPRWTGGPHQLDPDVGERTSLAPLDQDRTWRDADGDEAVHGAGGPVPPDHAAAAREELEGRGDAAAEMAADATSAGDGDDRAAFDADPAGDGDDTVEEDTVPYDAVFGDQTQVAFDDVFVDRPWPDMPGHAGRRSPRRRPGRPRGPRRGAGAAVVAAVAAGCTGLLLWVDVPVPGDATRHDSRVAPDAPPASSAPGPCPPAGDVTAGGAGERARQGGVLAASPGGHGSGTRDLAPADTPAGAGSPPRGTRQPGTGAEPEAGTGAGIDTVADVDGDGCGEALHVEGRVVEVAGERWSVGQPDDTVAVGDWDCDGVATPALYRPSTGDVFVFPAWASPGEPVTVEPVAKVAGGRRLGVVRAAGDGGSCDAPVVELATGGHRAVDVAR